MKAKSHLILALGGILDIMSHQITNQDLLSTLKTISTTLGQAESTINTYKNGPSAPTNSPHVRYCVPRALLTKTYSVILPASNFC